MELMISRALQRAPSFDYPSNSAFERQEASALEYLENPASARQEAPAFEYPVPAFSASTFSVTWIKFEIETLCHYAVLL